MHWCACIRFIYNGELFNRDCLLPFLYGPLWKILIPNGDLFKQDVLSLSLFIKINFSGCSWGCWGWVWVLLWKWHFPGYPHPKPKPNPSHPRHHGRRLFRRVGWGKGPLWGQTPTADSLEIMWPGESRDSSSETLRKQRLLHARGAR